MFIFASVKIQTWALIILKCFYYRALKYEIWKDRLIVFVLVFEVSLLNDRP